MYAMTLEKPQLSPDVIISTINAVQPGLVFNRALRLFSYIANLDSHAIVYSVK